MFTSFILQKSTLVIEKINFDVDPAVLKMSVSLRNNYINDSILNVTMALYKTLYDVRADLVVFVADGAADESYQREVFRNSLNIPKVLAGFRGNFMTKPIIESVLKAINVELEFPLKPITYKLTNWIIPGKNIPSSVFKGKFLAQVTYYMKTFEKLKRWSRLVIKNYGMVS